jgi:hypothetical protein
MWRTYETGEWILDVYGDNMYGSLLRNTETGEEFMVESLCSWRVLPRDDFVVNISEGALGCRYLAVSDGCDMSGYAVGSINGVGFLRVTEVANYEQVLMDEIDKLNRIIEKTTAEIKTFKLQKIHRTVDFDVYIYDGIHIIKRGDRFYYRRYSGSYGNLYFEEYIIRGGTETTMRVEFGDAVCYFRFVGNSLERSLIEIDKKIFGSRRTEISLMNERIEKLEEILTDLNPAVLT